MLNKRIYIKYLGENGLIENHPIGLTLRLERCRIKMTQEEVACRLDINRKTLQNYEKGITKIPITIFLRLVNLYHIDIIDIYEI